MGIIYLYKIKKKKKRIREFESKALISHTNKDTLISTYPPNKNETGKYKPLLDIVVCRNIILFGYMSRHTSLAKMILQGSVEVSRNRLLPQISWMNDKVDWTNVPLRELLNNIADREEWRKMISSLLSAIPTTTSSWLSY